MRRTTGTRLVAMFVVGAAAGLLTYWGSTAVAGHPGPRSVEQHELGYSYSFDVLPPAWATPVAILAGFVAAAAAWTALRTRAKQQTPG